MTKSKKPNLLKQLLLKKQAAKKSATALGIVADSDLSRKFQAGEKAQPKIRRGGRNGSGKP